MKLRTQHQLERHIYKYRYYRTMIRKLKKRRDVEFRIIDTITHGKAKESLHQKELEVNYETPMWL